MVAARREIERYRTKDGLYRTWLADERTYRCFYTRYAGSQWNPPDVAVEMHVYLFLAGHDSAAAGPLCEALRRRMDDDHIWVWYTVAPLIPVLREADLARMGCALRVPESRVARALPGQEPYLTQTRLLNSLLVGESPPLAGCLSPGPPRGGRGRLRQHDLHTAAPLSQRPVCRPAALSLVRRLRLRAFGSGSTSRRRAGGAEPCPCRTGP